MSRPSRPKAAFLGGLKNVKLKKVTQKSGGEGRSEMLRKAYCESQMRKKAREQKLFRHLASKRGLTRNVSRLAGTTYELGRLVVTTGDDTKVKFATFQVNSTIEKWASKLNRFLENESRSGIPVDFLICPEGFARPDVALDIGAPIAKRNKCYLVLGSGLNVRGTNYFNTAVVIDRDGKCICKYDKRCCNGLVHTPGVRSGFFATEFGLAAVLICLDVESEEFIKEALDAGVKILLNPSFIPATRKTHDEMEWRSGLLAMTRRLGFYAKANNMCVVRCDASRPHARGTSQIITPKMSRMAASAKTDVVVGTVRCRRNSRVEKKKREKPRRSAAAFETLRADESMARSRSERFDRSGARCNMWTLRTSTNSATRDPAGSLQRRTFHSHVIAMSKKNDSKHGLAAFASCRSNMVSLWELNRRTQISSFRCPEVDMPRLESAWSSALCFSNRYNIGVAATSGAACLWTLRNEESQAVVLGPALCPKWTLAHGGISDVDILTAFTAGCEEARLAADAVSIVLCAFDGSWILLDHRAKQSRTMSVTPTVPTSSYKSCRSMSRPRARWIATNMLCVQRESHVEIVDVRKPTRERLLYSLDLAPSLGNGESSTLQIASFQTGMFGSSELCVVGTATGGTALVKLDVGTGGPFVAAASKAMHRGGETSFLAPLSSGGMISIDSKRSQAHLWSWNSATATGDKATVLSHQTSFDESPALMSAAYDACSGAIVFAFDDRLSVCECMLNGERVPWEAALI